MSALLSRNTSARPGVTGTARVDRDIDRLLRRVGPGDIVVLDILDLDRHHRRRAGRRRHRRRGQRFAVDLRPLPEPRARRCWWPTASTLIDSAGPEVFKKIKDGAKIRLHDGGVYAGDRRLVHGVGAQRRRDRRPDARGQDRTGRASGGVRRQHHRVHPQREPAADRRDRHPRHRRRRLPPPRRGGGRRSRAPRTTSRRSSRSSRSTSRCWSVSAPAPTSLREVRVPAAADRRRPRPDERRRAQVRRPGGAARRRRRTCQRPGAHPGSRHRGDDVPGRGFGRRPGAAARRSPRRLADRHRRPHRPASRSSSTAPASRATRRRSSPG